MILENIRELARTLNKAGLVQFADSLVRLVDYINADDKTKFDTTLIFQVNPIELAKQMANLSTIDFAVASAGLVNVAAKLATMNDPVAKAMVNLLSSVVVVPTPGDVKPNRDAVLAKEPKRPTASDNILKNFVDLGLPSGILWAKSNLDQNTTSKDKGKGTYYSFGETYTKSGFGVRNYPNLRPSNWIGAGSSPTPGGEVTYTSYNGTKLDTTDISNMEVNDIKRQFPVYSGGDNSKVDGIEYDSKAAIAALVNSKSQLKSENDVAHLMFNNDNVRIPTATEIEELIDNTKVTNKTDKITVTSDNNPKDSSGKVKYYNMTEAYDFDPTSKCILAEKEDDDNTIEIPIVGYYNGPEQIYRVDQEVLLDGKTLTYNDTNKYVVLFWSSTLRDETSAKCLTYNYSNGMLHVESSGCSAGIQIRPIYTGLCEAIVKYNRRSGSDWDSFRSLIESYNEKALIWNDEHPDDIAEEIDLSEYEEIPEN